MNEHKKSKLSDIARIELQSLDEDQKSDVVDMMDLISKEVFEKTILYFNVVKSGSPLAGDVLLGMLEEEKEKSTLRYVIASYVVRAIGDLTDFIADAAKDIDDVEKAEQEAKQKMILKYTKIKNQKN